MTEHLSRRTKFLYGIGDTGFSLTSTILGAYFAIFLSDVVHLDLSVAAMAIMVGRIWDWVNDPLIGHISDRTRTRWGRRRPFLLFGFMPFALSFALLWWRPPLEGQLALGVYYALVYVLYEAAATFVYMPYFALTPELTPDYDERTSLTSYRMFFSIFASLIAFVVPSFLIGRLVPENAPRVLLMGFIFGIAGALPLLLTFWGTRERDEYQAQAQPKILPSLRAAIKNRPFVFSIAMFLLTWVAVKLIESTLLYFIKYVVERESESDLLMLIIFGVAILVLPFWNWASERWNKRWAYVIGIAFWAVVQIAIITLSPSTSLWLLLLLSAMAGIGVSAAHVIPWAIIPDAIEWDELQTGERHEGMFYSLTTLTQKIAMSAALPLALLLLDATGYVANAAQQPASALMGIRLLVGPIPAVLLCGGIVFAIVYPLGREQHADAVRELAQRRAERTQEAE
jgi:GPH family glycoside/pentoside/hexuronide:cation symporter